MVARIGQRPHRFVQFVAPTGPLFDDTRMTAAGIARNGPGLYYGFTAVDGSGTVTVYEGENTSGTVLQTVAAPALGVFQALPSPVSVAHVYVSQGSRQVLYRVD